MARSHPIQHMFAICLPKIRPDTMCAIHTRTMQTPMWASVQTEASGHTLTAYCWDVCVLDAGIVYTHGEVAKKANSLVAVFVATKSNF